MVFFNHLVLLLCMTWTVSSFNVATRSNTTEFILSPVIRATNKSGQSLPNNIRSSFYGHSLKFPDNSSKRPSVATAWWSRYQPYLMAYPSDSNIRFTWYRRHSFQRPIKDRIPTIYDQLPKRLFVTAPKMTDGLSPADQAHIPDRSTSQPTPATGSAESCDFSASNTACEFAGFPNASAGDNFGLSLAADGPRLAACSPTKSLNCTKSMVSPGVCYRSQDRGKTWNWLKQEPPKCQITNADVIFVLDGSKSVGADSFEKVKVWISSLSSDFDIESGSSQIGVIQYSHYYRALTLDNQRFIKTEVELGKYRSIADLKTAVDKIKLHGFTTYTARAMQKAALDYQASSRWGDDKVSKVMILLTDGKANDSNILDKTADDLRNLGIITFAVGVAKYNVEELRTIATGNKSSSERVFRVASFSDLSKISGKLSEQIRSVALEGSGHSSSTGFNMELSQRGFSMKKSDQVTVM